MSATPYSYERFKEESKTLTQALLDSDLTSSHLTICEVRTIDEEDPRFDFMPQEL